MPSGYFSISDPFSFSFTYLSAGSLFHNSGLSIGGSPNTGNLWVNLPRATYTKIQGGRKLIVDNKQLTRADAQSFAKYFSSKNASIPWILGPASLIPVMGTAITIVTSTLDGLQRIGQPPIDSSQLAVLMAEGGAFQRRIAEEPAGRLPATVFYSVKVGNEVRMYGICSSTYGLNVMA